MKTKSPKREEIKEYLKTKEDVFNFLLTKKILGIILSILSVIAVIFWVGFSSYIEHTVKTEINKSIAENIKEEYDFLKARNEIGELTDLAISTGLIKYHDELKKHQSKPFKEKIQIIAKAEIRRVEAFFSYHGDEYFSDEDVMVKNDSGQIIKGYNIPAELLIKKFHETDNFGEKTTILPMLSNRYEYVDVVPSFFLEVAENTDNLRMRYVALTSLQHIIDNYGANRFNLNANINLWKQEKNNYFTRAEDIREKREIAAEKRRLREEKKKQNQNKH